MADGNSPEAMYRPPWRLQVVKSDVCVWYDLDGEMVMAYKPDGYDFWTVVDSTNVAVEGRSVGPFDSLDAAIERLNEGIPEIEL